MMKFLGLGKEGRTMSPIITSSEAEPVSTGIPDYRIADLKSLEEATKGPIYRFFQLFGIGWRQGFLEVRLAHPLFHHPDRGT